MVRRKTAAIIVQIFMNDRKSGFEEFFSAPQIGKTEFPICLPLEDLQTPKERLFSRRAAGKFPFPCKNGSAEKVANETGFVTNKWRIFRLTGAFGCYCEA